MACGADMGEFVFNKADRNVITRLYSNYQIGRCIPSRGDLDSQMVVIGSFFADDAQSYCRLSMLRKLVTKLIDSSFKFYFQLPID